MNHLLPLVLSSALFTLTSVVAPTTASARFENPSNHNRSALSTSQSELIRGNLNPVKPHGELLAQAKTNWTCYSSWGDHVGYLAIWWGHTKADAAYGCNETYKLDCGGKCYAREGHRKPPPEGKRLGSCNPFAASARRAQRYCDR